MKNVFRHSFTPVIFASILGFSACTPAQPDETQVQSPVQEIQETPLREGVRSHYDVLSHHDTNATFAGTREHVCMGRSMLCPDRCGHSGTLAVFKIESYNTYEKPSKYGDPKTDEFVVMLKSTTGESDVPKDIVQQISALSAGDKVRLVWEHIYVTDENGSQFPERIIRSVKKVK